MNAQYKNPPSQIFEKYTFTKSSHDSNQFSSLLFRRAPLKQISGGETDEITEDISIGFSFKFCEKKYDRVNASINGFLVLREEEDDSSIDLTKFFNIEIDPWNTDPDNVWKNGCNALIRQQFQSPGILVCPWFDSLKSTSLIGSVQNQNGEITPYHDVDEVNSGITYLSGADQNGKFLIVRWKVYSHHQQELSSVQKTVLVFETCLRQDGGIKFSYYPVETNSLLNKSDLTTEGATIGIFINDNGWNFRDLSSAIRHPSDDIRNISEFGGFLYDESYEDPSVFNGQLVYTPYNSSLVCLQANDVQPSDISGDLVPPSLIGRISNWPSKDRKKKIFHLSPPKRVRKPLPKREINSQYLENSLPKSKRSLKSTSEPIVYNDNFTLNFSETIENLDRPARIQRFYGDGFDGADERQDLFPGLKFPGTQKPNLYHRPAEKTINPSLPFKDGFSMEEDVRAKTFFDIDLPVHHSLQMEGRRSSIYFYNKKINGFFKPNPGDSIDPEEFVNDNNVANHTLPNDYRGFGPTGKNISTSIGDIQNNPELNIQSVSANSTNKPWSVQNRDKFLTKKYPETVQNNSSYLPNDDETWEVPIDYPFLLESITMEIPVEVGDGWSSDKTTSALALGDYLLMDPKYGSNAIKYGFSTRCLDFAGPGITFSVFNKLTSEEGTRLDLVAKGCITHDNDVESNIAIRSTWSELLKPENDQNEMANVWVLEPEGFASFGSTPGCVISPDYNGDFSGVAKVKLDTNSSYGPSVTSLLVLPDPSHEGSATVNSIQRSRIATEFCKTKEFRLPWTFDSSNYILTNRLRSINSFGLDESGNITSPRQKFTLRKRESEKELESMPNPFYLGDKIEDFPKPIRDILDPAINPDLRVIFHATIPILNTEDSKYLLMPGDKLTLSVSKNRPALFGNGQFLCSQFPKFRHDLSHDIKIKTGNVKIRFHGILQSADKQIENPSNQQFRNHSIPQEISNGLITNQYETFLSKDFRGTYTDHFIFGNLLNFIKNVDNTSALFVEKDYGVSIFNKENIDPQIVYPYPPSNQFSNLEDPSSFTRQYRDLLLKNKNDRIISGDNSVVIEEIPDYCRFLLNTSSRSKRLQPQKELSGIQRTLRMVDPSERVFDSTTPSIKGILSANMTSVFKIGDPADMFESYLDLDYGGNGVQTTSLPEDILPKAYGTVLFDMPAQFVSDTANPQTVPDNLINTTWNWTFPFDDLYKEVQRDVDLDSSFVATQEVQNLFVDQEVTSISAKTPIDHFLPGRFLKVNGEPTFNFCIDKNMFRINFLNSESRESTVGLNKEDLAKVFFGFGDDNTLSDITLSGQSYRAGSKYQPRFRETTIVDTNDVLEIDLNDNEISKFGSISRSYSCSPIIRGWKYGISSGVVQYSTAVFRRGSYGQFRDMLEQRTYTKNIDMSERGKISNDPGPVSISFVDYMCRTTDPLNTWAQNITFDASSTLPYFDGVPRNRPPIDINNLDNTIIKLDI